MFHSSTVVVILLLPLEMVIKPRIVMMIIAKQTRDSMESKYSKCNKNVEQMLYGFARFRFQITNY